MDAVESYDERNFFTSQFQMTSISDKKLSILSIEDFSMTKLKWITCLKDCVPIHTLKACLISNFGYSNNLKLLLHRDDNKNE
jgi:hypothetical protein